MATTRHVYIDPVTHLSMLQILHNEGVVGSGGVSFELFVDGRKAHSSVVPQASQLERGVPAVALLTATGLGVIGGASRAQQTLAQQLQVCLRLSLHFDG